MKSVLSWLILGLGVFVGGDTARAALISVDFVAGSGDGLLTRDTVSGIEWLDHGGSLGRSYADVSSNLGLGGDFEGFRYSTHEEVNQLIIHAGLPSENYFDAPLYAPALAFIGLIGGTVLSPSNASVLGVINLPFGQSYQLKGVAVNTAFSFGGVAYVTCCVTPDATGFGLGDPPQAFSSWLVRAIPEPPIAVLLGGVLVAFGSAGVRMRQVGIP